MEDDDSGVVSTEIDAETDKTDVKITRRHATIDWLSGYSEGEKRGVSEVLDALVVILRGIGISEREIDVIALKILERSGRHSLFR